jgi:hypothetical protein
MTDNLPEHLNNDALAEFCQDIIHNLVKYGGLTPQEARQKLDESGVCLPENMQTEMQRALLFHEVPYYWAMELLHAKTNPTWWRDSNLWPPKDAE